MSIEAIRADSAQVRDHIVAAYQSVSGARERLADAVRLLTDLDRNHPGSLLPPEHLRADEQLEECLAHLTATLACLDRFVAGL